METLGFLWKIVNINKKPHLYLKYNGGEWCTFPRRGFGSKKTLFHFASEFWESYKKTGVYCDRKNCVCYILGSYSDGGSQYCTICPKGKYCPFIHNATELPCLPGTFSFGGARACLSCPSGWKCPNLDGSGNASCLSVSTCSCVCAFVYFMRGFVRGFMCKFCAWDAIVLFVLFGMSKMWLSTLNKNF